MAFLKDNRVIIAIGAAVVILAAIILALVFTGGDKPTEPPPAAMGGLTVDVADAPTLSPTRELRCFVSGQFVGMATLAECAQRNGLATNALDVGIDESGELVAAPTASLAPPPVLPGLDVPPADTKPVDDVTKPTPSDNRPAPAASGNACLRHTGDDWRVLGNGMSMSACVQALYAGTCVRPGEALYGRWGDTSLRLVPRRVEQSTDNVRFRTLAEQDRNCQFTGLN